MGKVKSTMSERITTNLPVMKSIVEGGSTSTKRIENEEQRKEIETEEKVSKERTEKIEIEEKVSDRYKFEWSVFSVTSGCYRSPEEHDSFKNWLELKQRLIFSFRSLREELSSG